jgi:hypothetical protein
MEQMTVRGLPDSLRTDSWWLASNSEPEPTTSTPRRPGWISKLPQLEPKSLAILLGLVALFDLLFYGETAGISVAVFCLALSAAILAARQEPLNRAKWMRGMGFAVVCNLPVIELFQPLSLLFSIGGIIVLAAWVMHDRLVSGWQAFWLFLKLLAFSVFLLPASTILTVSQMRTRGGAINGLKGAILPVGLGGVFLILLTSANPLFEQVLRDLASPDWIDLSMIDRVFLWGFVACVLWPWLNLPRPRSQTFSIDPAFRLPFPSGIINAQSIRTSLILFNMMFAAQTITDLSIFAGGASLPEGMTYATYAHRGAYPLVVTALLAGVFAMLTARMTADNQMLRILLFLWLGQNMFLVFSAAFRLDLYVETYGLTHLRMAAFIWMGLVFIGLCLTLFQVIRGLGIGWLLRMNTAVSIATLFVCCFVNFTDIIARHNLNVASFKTSVDEWYICSLGRYAVPAILEYRDATGIPVCDDFYPRLPLRDPIADWREWGFRRAQLDVYLATYEQELTDNARPYPHR